MNSVRKTTIIILFLSLFFSNELFSQSSIDSSSYLRFVVDKYTGGIWIELYKKNILVADYGYASSSSVNDIVHYYYDSTGSLYMTKEWFNGKEDVSVKKEGSTFILRGRFYNKGDTLLYDDKKRAVELRRFKYRSNKIVEWYLYYYCYECKIEDKYPW